MKETTVPKVNTLLIKFSIKIFLLKSSPKSFLQHRHYHVLPGPACGQSIRHRNRRTDHPERPAKCRQQPSGQRRIHRRRRRGGYALQSGITGPGSVCSGRDVEKYGLYFRGQRKKASFKCKYISIRVMEKWWH